MLPPPFEDVQRRCRAALEEPALVRVADALAQHHVDAALGERLVADVSEHTPAVRDRIVALATAVGSTDGSLERLLLLRSAVRALPRVPSLSVSDDVKRRFCEAFEYVACPPPQATLDAARGSFEALCKIATLRRFPAGQFHWEVSGLPRSWVLKVTGRERLTLLWWIAARLKGFSPLFVVHLNPIRKNRNVVTEPEANRSYFRMAEAVALQPAIKGVLVSSWLNSPDIGAISPHLAWFNRTIAENGGLVVSMGPAELDTGVLTRSPERQQAYEAGTFKPMTGLVIWPRAAVLAWAAAHPDLGKIASRPRTLNAETVPHAVAGHIG